jgi:4-hydroxybenzoate polyprenyltransferase
MLALFVASTAMLNWLCVSLLPVAAVLVVGYSFSKRFTWLCHYWLGLACQCATMGAFLGISGRFEFRYFVFCAAVVLWVGGFDVIYAFQDVEVDRRQGIKSLPASLGRLLAWMAAAGSHALVVVFLAGAALFWPLGAPYLVGVGIVALLLAAEHLILLLEPSFGVATRAAGEDPGERHLNVASYRINEIIPFVVLAGLAVDLYLI